MIVKRGMPRQGADDSCACGWRHAVHLRQVRMACSSTANASPDELAPPLHRAVLLQVAELPRKLHGWPRCSLSRLGLLLPSEAFNVPCPPGRRWVAQLLRRAARCSDEWPTWTARQYCMAIEALTLLH